MKAFALAFVLALALPLAAAAIPATCADPCAIQGGSTGYVAPVVTIASGTTVVWQGTDGAGHVTVDGTTAASEGSCIAAPFTQGIDSPAVTLAIADGALTATIGGETATCTNAIALPGGAGFALPYLCAIHATMRGTIVVQ